MTAKATNKIGDSDDSGLALVRVTITMRALLYEFVNQAVREEGYTSLSGYIQALIRQEMRSRGRKKKPKE